MRLAERESDVGQLQLLDPFGERGEIVLRDVFCDDRSSHPDTRRQAHRVVAAAGADIGHRHAGPDLDTACDLAVFVESIAAILGRAAGADNRRHRAPGRGKLACRHARLSQIVNLRGECARPRQRNQHRCAGQHASRDHR